MRNHPHLGHPNTPPQSCGRHEMAPGPPIPCGQPTDLVEQAKGDVEKIRIAKSLRQETTMTLG